MRLFYNRRSENKKETNYTACYNASANSTASSIQLYVPMGTYDILMLAGNYTDDADLPEHFFWGKKENGDPIGGDLPVHILLGSGAVQEKLLAKGTNKVEILLSSIDSEINIPDPLLTGQKLDSSRPITISLTLRNDFLWERMPGIWCMLRTADTNTPLNDMYGTEEGGVYSGIVVSSEPVTGTRTLRTAWFENGSTPTTAGEEDIIGWCVILEEHRDKRLGSNYGWYFFNSFNTTHTGNMLETVTFSDAAKVEFNVDWRDE